MTNIRKLLVGLVLLGAPGAVLADCTLQEVSTVNFADYDANIRISETKPAPGAALKIRVKCPAGVQYDLRIRPADRVGTQHEMGAKFPCFTYPNAGQSFVTGVIEIPSGNFAGGSEIFSSMPSVAGNSRNIRDDAVATGSDQTVFVSMRLRRDSTATGDYAPLPMSGSLDDAFVVSVHPLVGDVVDRKVSVRMNSRQNCVNTGEGNGACPATSHNWGAACYGSMPMQPHLAQYRVINTNSLYEGQTDMICRSGQWFPMDGRPSTCLQAGNLAPQPEAVPCQDCDYRVQFMLPPAGCAPYTRFSMAGTARLEAQRADGQPLTGGSAYSQPFAWRSDGTQMRQNEEWYRSVTTGDYRWQPRIYMASRTFENGSKDAGNTNCAYVNVNGMPGTGNFQQMTDAQFANDALFGDGLDLRVFYYGYNMRYANELTLVPTVTSMGTVIDLAFTPVVRTGNPDPAMFGRTDVPQKFRFAFRGPETALMNQFDERIFYVGGNATRTIPEYRFTRFTAYDTTVRPNYPHGGYRDVWEFQAWNLGTLKVPGGSLNAVRGAMLGYRYEITYNNSEFVTDGSFTPASNAVARVTTPAGIFAAPGKGTLFLTESQSRLLLPDRPEYLRYNRERGRVLAYGGTISQNNSVYIWDENANNLALWHGTNHSAFGTLASGNTILSYIRVLRPRVTPSP